MRYLPLSLVVLLAACGDDGMTRNFGLSRDSAPETMASTQMPLSAPPGLTQRPTRPVMIGSSRQSQPPPEPNSGSAGQEALLQAAGPTAEADIRTSINENSGLVYPDQAFVDQLMAWTPASGGKPVIMQSSSGGGWFSRIF
jgi:hypothetical protein